jgi:hypothetical protein
MEENKNSSQQGSNTNQGSNASKGAENAGNDSGASNPQDGSEWGNYRTRELSSNADQNREENSNTSESSSS